MSRSWLLLGLLLAAILVALGLYMGAAVLVYDWVSRVEADCGGRFAENTPASWSPPSWAEGFDPSPYVVPDYREVGFASRDPGIELHGWWLPSRDGDSAPAVVIVHGVGACVRDREVLAPAGMLHSLGYAVLLVDLRDHGSSTVEDGRTAIGTEEYRDVVGAVDWLVEGGVEPGRVGLLGTSMGAATAIIAAGQDERVVAVWSDTAYADIETRLGEELEARGLPWLLAPAATLAARIVSGDDLASHTILGEVVNLGGRHLFVTHGEEDEATFVSHAHELTKAARSAGVLVDEWIVPETGHVDAMWLHTDEYAERLAGFFETALPR